MSSNLEDIWKDVTNSMPKPVSEWWWSLLLKKYHEKGRNSHDFRNLTERFDYFAEVQSKVKNPTALCLALFFQHFDYNPKSVNAELINVENFDKFATEAGISEDSDLYKEIRHLLEAAATHCTEEHKIEGAFGEEDLHYFLDIDMAILGSSPEHYAQYNSDLEEEYSFLDVNSYRNLRRKVLQSFLLIPNIFATREFREKYEAQARSNITQELDRLKGLWTKAGRTAAD